MAYQYNGKDDLIALPNRVVQTYPSGLVRVERSFVCIKSNVEKFRRKLKINSPMPLPDDGSPAIDGIFIFPEPQEIVRDDGFVEFRVSAYGNTSSFSQSKSINSTIKGEYSYEYNEYDKDANKMIRSNPYLPSINEIYTRFGVSPSSQRFNPLTTRPNVEAPLVIDAGTGQELVNEYYFQPDALEIDGDMYSLEIRTFVSVTLDSYSSTNFGQFTEYNVTWKSQATKSRLYLKQL